METPSLEFRSPEEAVQWLRDNATRNFQRSLPSAILDSSGHVVAAGIALPAASLESVQFVVHASVAPDFPLDRAATLVQEDGATRRIEHATPVERPTFYPWVPLSLSLVLAPKKA